MFNIYYLPLYLVLKWLNAKVEDVGIPDPESQFFELPIQKRAGLLFFTLFEKRRWLVKQKPLKFRIMNWSCIDSLEVNRWNIASEYPVCRCWFSREFHHKKRNFWNSCMKHIFCNKLWILTASWTLVVLGNMLHP